MKNVNFGFGQILTAPPKWVVAVVAITSILLYSAQQMVQGSPTMTDVNKLHYVNILSNAQYVILGIAALIGIKPQKEEVSNENT